MNLQSLLFLLILFGFIVAKWPFLEQSLDRDEGTYLYLGQTILDGATPYTDSYEMKPPGVYYNYAWVRMIVGSSDYSVRLLSLLVSTLNILFLFLVARKWGWQWGALWTALTFIIMQMVPHFLSSALLLEPLVLLFFLIGLWLWEMRKGLLLSAFLPGILFAWAILTKQNALFLVIGYFIPFLLFNIRNRLAYTRLGVMAAGIFSLSFLMGAILWLQGSWSDFIYWVFQYPSQIYTQSVSIPKGVDLFSTFFNQVFWMTPFLWLISFLGLIIPFFWNAKSSSARHLYVVMGFVFGFLSICPGLRFYGHYWLLWLPSIALSVGAFAEAIQERIPKAKRKMILVAATGLYLAGHIAYQSKLYWKPNILQWERIVYGKNPNYEIKKICEELKALNIKDEDLIVFGSEPQAYFYLNIDPPSPHVFLSFMNKRHDRRVQMQEEFTNAIKGKKPSYALFVNFPYSWSITDSDVLDVYQWTRGYISNFYTPIGLYQLSDEYQLSIRWSNTVEDLTPSSPTYVWAMKRNQIRF